MSASKIKNREARQKALDWLFNEYLRPYQRAWLCDPSRKRIYLKARQIGISDLIALEMVLTSSGNNPFALTHNCTIVSKTEKDAHDVIKKAKKWVRLLRRIPGLEKSLRTDAWSASEIEFVSTGYRIVSQTQNADAGRGKTGHLYLDEYGFYVWQREIWTGAVPGTFAVPGLRISIVCTPNGTGDHFHEVWTDTHKYPDWARHKTDVYEAVSMGFPLIVDEIRGDFTSDQWSQEMECKFIGGAHEYFSGELLRDSHATHTREPEAVLWLGVDTASVVDTTAVQCVWIQRDGLWLGDTYVIEHLQYETDTLRKRIGQDTVLDALIQHLRPRGAVFDITGDMSRKVRGFASIFKIIQHSRGGEQLILPQNVTKEWKDLEVEEVKTSLECGRLKFADGRVDYVLSREHAGEFAHTRFLDPGLAGAFVQQCFGRSDFPVLTQDFRKIHRKWLGPNTTTFDAERDGTGHADSFWAAVFGHSVARKGKLGTVQAAQQPTQVQAAPSYSGYL